MGYCRPVHTGARKASKPSTEAMEAEEVEPIEWVWRDKRLSKLQKELYLLVQHWDCWINPNSLSCL